MPPAFYKAFGLEDLSSKSSTSFFCIQCFLILHQSGHCCILINPSLKITMFFHPGIVSVATNRSEKTASHLSETSSWLSEPYGLHNRLCRLQSPLLSPWVATHAHIKWACKMVSFSIQSRKMSRSAGQPGIKCFCFQCISMKIKNVFSRFNFLDNSVLRSHS